MNIEETIRQYEREALEADLRARSAVAKAEAIHNALNVATRFYIDQITAPWIALAEHIRAQRRGGERG
jgi:hypothetical protein